MGEQLTSDERGILLRLARRSIEAAVNHKPLPPLDRDGLPARLLQPGASFVTLTIRNELRGCVGALVPYGPLVDDVREHAVAAALEDRRFRPVSSDELPLLRIEISRLTLPEELEYNSPLELPDLIRPNIDGVTVFDGWQRATFLPQVWEKLPDTELFLDHLCQKMGAAPDLWRRRILRVQTYQVEEFHE